MVLYSWRREKPLHVSTGRKYVLRVQNCALLVPSIIENGDRRRAISNVNQRKTEWNLALSRPDQK